MNEHEARLVAQLNQLARLHTALKKARNALTAQNALDDALAAEIEEALNFGEVDAGERLESHIAAEVERRKGRGDVGKV
jgi:hypothetical protein